ncbi:unnamed protein product [Arctogadus glacialis]
MRLNTAVCSREESATGSAQALQQSGVTADRLGLSRVSPAELLVRELQSHGDRGRHLQDVLERGEPVPEVGDPVLKGPPSPGCEGPSDTPRLLCSQSRVLQHVV